MAATLTVKEVAEQLGTDGRTLRKFLRHEATEAGGTIGEDTPGKGGRYSLEARSVKGLQKRFDLWSAARKTSATETESDTEEVSEEEMTDEALEVEEV